MKKLILTLSLLSLLIGCGDDVTNINGYTDAEVKALIDSTLQSQDAIILTDTVFQQTVDTIYNRVIDTVTNELVDTIYQRVIDTIYNDLVDTIYTRVVDTIMNELVDTMYQRIVDTVYHELIDTIYNRVVDTVFYTLENVGINTELPKDTTITMYDTTDNVIVAKVYKGIVYKNVFYDTTKYRYNACPEERNMMKIEENYTSTRVDVYSTNRCGLIDVPTWDDFGWKYDRHVISLGNITSKFKRLPGWRLFNAKDAYVLRDNLDRVISDGSEVYLSTISEKDGYIYNFEANVATQYSPSQTSKGKFIKYMCAYEL